MDIDRRVDVKEITALVQASQLGDRAAFGALVQGFRYSAMELAVRLLWDRELADEVVQDSFVKAWIQIKQLRQAGRFRTWFFRIVTNTALNYVRDQRRYTDLQQNVARTRKDSDVSTRSYTQELNECLQAALAQLGEKEALAISLTGLEELSYGQAADVMNCSMTSLRQHLFRARKKLKVMLKDYLE